MICAEMLERMPIREFHDRLILRHTELNGTPTRQQTPEEMYNALSKYRAKR